MESTTTPRIVLGQETHSPGLADLHDKRAGQVGRPGYRALAGRDPVYLRRTDPDLAECEVSREEFESAWARARPQP